MRQGQPARGNAAKKNRTETPGIKPRQEKLNGLGQVNLEAEICSRMSVQTDKVASPMHFGNGDVLMTPWYWLIVLANDAEKYGPEECRLRIREGDSRVLGAMAMAFSKGLDAWFNSQYGPTTFQKPYAIRHKDGLIDAFLRVAKDFHATRFDTTEVDVGPLCDEVFPAIQAALNAVAELQSNHLRENESAKQADNFLRRARVHLQKFGPVFGDIAARSAGPAPGGEK